MSSQPANKRSWTYIDADMGTEVHVKIEDEPDPDCAASLIDTDNACKPFPLSDNEPPEITQMPAMNYKNADQEDVTPNDFRPLDKQHSFAPLVRAYFATDATAALENKTAAAVRRAEKALEAEKKKGWKAETKHVEALEAAVAKATREEQEMSRPLEAESYVCVFDPFLKTLQITAQYTNHTGTPAKVVSSLAMQEGMRIVDSWADVHGYKQDRKFMPNEQAEAECKALSASSNKGGARQIASKFALDHQTDVPAFAPGMGPDRAPATFAVTFVVAFTDVEEHALRLPEENHQSAREVSDFAVQVPPISGSGRVVPFTLTLLDSKGTDERMLPSRASAKLDAELRGVPTYWVGGKGAFSLTFRGPYAQPPLLRWRTVKEAFDASLDFEVVALGGLAITEQEQITAKVLHWVPFSPTECVASVELESKPYVVDELGTSIPRTHHIIVFVDISGSMGMKVNGNTKTNRLIAFAELRRLCETVQNLPANFVKGRIVGPEDRFVLTIVRFHHEATTVAHPRIALGQGSATASAIEAALKSLESCHDTGGTAFTPCVHEISKHLHPTDYVSSLAMTDGQIFDPDQFKRALEEAKTKVAGWKSAAIGCGAWANYETAKLIGTDGAALLERFDPMVSSTALKLVGKCIADHATSLGVTVKNQILTKWGKDYETEQLYRGTCESCKGVDDVISNLEMGLGTKRYFTVVGHYVKGDGVVNPAVGLTLPPIVRVDGNGNEYPIPTSSAGAVRGADGVLRVFDPLFCAKGVKKLGLKGTVGIHERIMEGIGVREECTTSRTTARTEYFYQAWDNNAIDDDTHAKVPESLEGAIKHPELDWLSESFHYKCGRYGYSNQSPAGYHCGLSSSSVAVPAVAPAALSSGSGEAEADPAFRSLSAADEGEGDSTVYRSADADEDEDPSDPVDPTPEKAEVEIEELGDTDGVPSFESLATSFGNAKVRFLLSSLQGAKSASKEIVATLNIAVDGLSKLVESKTGDAPMDLDDVLAKTAGPSLKDLTSSLQELFSVLNCFALRFHILNHFDGFVNHLGTDQHDVACDAPKALSRAKYLLRYAEKLQSKLSAM